MNISLQKSEMIKGVAIIMMLIHHLFAYPGRIAENITIYRISDFFNIEYNVAGFFKICVPIFLFLSGYGFSTKKTISFRYVIGKIKRIYISYWLAFAIFVTIGIVFFQSERFSFDAITLMENLSGFKSTYNDEWWFFKLYVMDIFALPFIIKIDSKTLLISAFPMVAIGKLLFIYGGAPDFIVEFLVSIFPFVSGLVFGRVYSGNEKNKSIIKITKLISITNPILLIIMSVLAYKMGKTMGLMFISPLFVIFISTCINSLNYFTNSILMALGRNSLYMWLTHSFYCYYFAQEFIFYPKYSLLIVIWLVIVSYLTSIVLVKIERLVYNNNVMKNKIA
ncbi:hypothetical protein SM12BL3_14620 [Serratia marcescens]|nr:hypothetical protein SM12BL3_14620 [Serratia marcescens]